jgi:hypothetical protein
MLGGMNRFPQSRQCAARNVVHLYKGRHLCLVVAAELKQQQPTEPSAAAADARYSAVDAAAAAKASSSSPIAAAFASLAAAAGADVSGVVLAESDTGAGRRLVAARDAERGDVLLSVPRCVFLFCFVWRGRI